MTDIVKNQKIRTSDTRNFKMIEQSWNPKNLWNSES